jgi:C-terminal processing protease CtpA/Prc
MNNGTLSQGELFILRLRKLKQVKILGQTSKGMLTYGSNYDKRITLPSGQIEIYPTDMRGNARRLQYEDIGIQPDVYLHYTTDWIEQTLSYIQTIR